MDPSFSPKSPILMESGINRHIADLIYAGIFNSLILVLSHMLYAVHAVAGLFVLSYFHQVFENLCLALVYILMVFRVHSFPLAVNGAVWGFMGLAMGFWPVMPVALPAGICADLFIRARGRTPGAVVAGYCFYATALGVANGWPLLLLKETSLAEQTARMDPFFAAMIQNATGPVFMAQVGGALVAAMAGSFLAMKWMNKHFKPAGLI